MPKYEEVIYMSGGRNATTNSELAGGSLALNMNTTINGTIAMNGAMTVVSGQTVAAANGANQTTLAANGSNGAGLPGISQNGWIKYTMGNNVIAVPYWIIS